MRRILTRYLPAYSIAIIYMLQNTEYNLRDFWRWYWQVKDWRHVPYRNQLVRTPVASSLLAGLILCQFVVYSYPVVLWQVADIVAL